MNLYQQLEANHNRRMAAESRFIDRLEKREAKAEKMIGTLIRNGKEVFYVWPEGGKYREGTEGELTAFLIRNKYA
jgi:hypothetical protein